MFDIPARHTFRTRIIGTTPNAHVTNAYAIVDGANGKTKAPVIPIAAIPPLRHIATRPTKLQEKTAE